MGAQQNQKCRLWRPRHAAPFFLDSPVIYSSPLSSRTLSHGGKLDSSAKIVRSS
jgi:hypothetical protein